VKAASEAVDNAFIDGVHLTVDEEQVWDAICAELNADDDPLHDALQASAQRQVLRALALDQITIDAVN